MMVNALTNGQILGTTPRPEKWIFHWFGRQRVKARKITSDPGPVHPPSLNESPLASATLPALPFRRITQPSRAPCTSANILACAEPGENQQSDLSTNQSHRIYSPVRLGTGDMITVKLEAPVSQPSPSVFKSSRAATVYQQGPRFNTHFYNNGPANYRNARPNLGTFPALHSDHISVPTPSFYLAGHMLPVSQAPRQQNIQNQASLGEHNYSAKPLSMRTEDIDVSSQYRLLTSSMEASQPFPTFYNEALDPSLAPLKHLTDVLERFRDEEGTYTKLVDLQERRELMNCLLDDELARRSPFQAAMGLVLLSKLGLEWDY